MKEKNDNNLINDKISDNKSNRNSTTDQKRFLNNQSEEGMTDFLLNKTDLEGIIYVFFKIIIFYKDNLMDIIFLISIEIQDNDSNKRNSFCNTSLIGAQENKHLTNSFSHNPTNISENLNTKAPDNSEISLKNTLVSQQPNANLLMTKIKTINKEQNKIESVPIDNYENTPESSCKIPSKSNEKLNKNENKGKISIEIIVPSKTLNMLKNFQNNIYIEMENKYGCQITKRTEVIYFYF